MKHILIVDDNKTNLVAAKQALNNDYKVTAVTMGSQALKFFENNTCDLILLDINMPDMDGFQVFEKLKELPECANIPVIFLTADNNSETENKCLEVGASDFIAKPFVATVMVSRIGRILELEDMRKKLSDQLQQKIQEVSDIKSKIQKDVLTDLWNRAYTENKVNEFIEQGRKGFLFMIDMDNFKAINDNYGHIEGDHTLIMFADSMRKYAKGSDILCRIGGDEFVMYVDGEGDKESIGELAHNIIKDLCDKLEDKKFKTNTSVSIGISQIPEDGENFEQLYNAADKALYYVKQNGKNDFHFFSEQKKEEEKRGANLVDLKYLQEFMSRADAGEGAYQLNLDNFHNIYNFIRRFVKRDDREVQILLFTLSAPENMLLSTEENEMAIDHMEQAIYKSLRRVDVSTRYSNKQIIVILMDSNIENGKLVAERIIGCYKELAGDSKIGFEYGIAMMDKNA